MVAEPKIPRQVKSRMVKENILNAATQLITENGYEYVTVNNVCTLAGVSVGSFYHHFENKDDLMAYYLAAAFEKYAEEFSEVQGIDVVANVLDCFGLYVRFILEQGVEFAKNYYTTKNKSLGSHPASGKRINLPILDRAAEFLTEGKKAGFILPSTDPTELAEELCTVEKGAIFDWAICDGSYNINSFSRRIMKAHLRVYVTEQYLEHFPDTYAQ